ncbi:MAG: PorV/PorQ family protein [Bacteroidota bacterium]
MKKFLIIYFILAGCLFGQTKVGSTAAPFLNLALGPRAIGMGGAFVATANDVTALYWNPAGASRAEHNGAMFSYSTMFADINYSWAGAMLNMGSMGTVGLNLAYLDYGSIDVTTLSAPEGTGESFTPHDMSIGLTYAINLTDRFSIGGTVKYVNTRIYNTSASAVAFDLGTLFISDIYGLRIGATISNFGTDMKLDGKDLYVQYDAYQQGKGNNDQILATLKTDEYPLPLTFRVGLAMDLLNTNMHRFTIGADALHPNDNAESVNVGGEYVFNNFLALRAGYKSLFLDNATEGLTLGFGINYNIDDNLGISVDYSYQDFDILEEVQHFSLGVRF